MWYYCYIINGTTEAQRLESDMPAHRAKGFGCTLCNRYCYKFFKYSSEQKSEDILIPWRTHSTHKKANDMPYLMCTRHCSEITYNMYMCVCSIAIITVCQSKKLSKNVKHPFQVIWLIRSRANLQAQYSGTRVHALNYHFIPLSCSWLVDRYLGCVMWLWVQSVSRGFTFWEKRHAYLSNFIDCLSRVFFYFPFSHLDSGQVY